MNRVVITGVGAVSAAGIGADALWSACRDGRSGVRDISFPSLPRQHVKSAATIGEDDNRLIAETFDSKFQDRVAKLALMAAREAVAQSGLMPEHFGSACGTVIGTGLGGLETIDSNYRAFAADNNARLDPMSVAKTMANAAASWVSMANGATGPLYCISTACSSGTQSIGLAYSLVASGQVHRCIAGGTETPLHPGSFRAWELLRVMTTSLNRPFSRDRNGMTLGEGAGIVILESLASAKERGAPILAEVAGYACNSDATDLLRPNPETVGDVMRAALRNARLQPMDIGYVNAHGTGTVANDVAEAEGLRRTFEGRLDTLAVSSTKPVHGHALGAAGALELIVALHALRAQIAPPTINFTETDPKIGIEPVPNIARRITTDAVMSNSFAFGGINASMVLKAV